MAGVSATGTFIGNHSCNQYFFTRMEVKYLIIVMGPPGPHRKLIQEKIIHVIGVVRVSAIWVVC